MGLGAHRTLGVRCRPCSGVVLLLSFAMVATLSSAAITPPLTNLPLSDNGNGTFSNPVLAGDFPDPDLLRIGTDYYLVTTSLQYMPAANILHSTDLVNWEVIAYAGQPRYDDPCYNMTETPGLCDNYTRYSGNQWATTIGVAPNGTWVVLYNDQLDGAHLSTAPSVTGPWTEQSIAANIPGGKLYDPGLLFDPDTGSAFVAVSNDGNIAVIELDASLTKSVSQYQVTQTQQYGQLEGCRMYKINSTYYVTTTFPSGNNGVLVFRSSTIYGPWEVRTLLNNTLQDYSNPFRASGQPALIDTPSGEWWAMLHLNPGVGEAGSGFSAVGRVLVMQPVTWTDGWPLIGVNGQLVATPLKKPAGLVGTPSAIRTSDEFSGPSLGLQWQWNMNPDDAKWSLTARPGYLRLATAKNTTGYLFVARNQLTQRVWVPATYATVKLDASSLVDNDVAGLAVFQLPYAYIAVRQQGGARSLVVAANGYPSDQDLAAIALPAPVIYLRALVTLKSNETAQFFYSTDNITYVQLGPSFPLQFSLRIFLGYRYSIFTFNTGTDQTGKADFDWFRLCGCPLSACRSQALSAGCNGYTSLAVTSATSPSSSASVPGPTSASGSSPQPAATPASPATTVKLGAESVVLLVAAMPLLAWSLLL